MPRFVSFVLFLIKSYWRRTHGILQIIIFAISVGFFLDPKYAPYDYEYVVLFRNVLMMVIAVVTSLQLSNGTFSRSLYVILSKISRKTFYLASLVATLIFTFGVGLFLDLWIVVFAKLPLFRYYTAEMIILSFVNIATVIAIMYLFSLYNMPKIYQIIGVLIVSLGAIPRWYTGLPAEQFFKPVSFLFPPLGQGILLQRMHSFSAGNLMFMVFYCSLAVAIGLSHFSRRDLAKL